LTLANAMLHTSAVIGLAPETRRAHKLLHPAPHTGYTGPIRGVQGLVGFCILCVRSRSDERVTGLHGLTGIYTGRQSPADASRTVLRSRDRNKALDRAVKTTTVPIECCPARETDSGCFDGGAFACMVFRDGLIMQASLTRTTFKASGWPWSEALLHPWASYL
jgi:hypothetical protein